jgi:hypothetical protein
MSSSGAQRSFDAVQNNLAIIKLHYKAVKNEINLLTMLDFIYPGELGA